MNWNGKMYQEIALYQEAMNRGAIDAAIDHLGRAHILSQLSVASHLLVHWHMFKFAIKTLDAKEISGQLLRLVVTVPGHLFRRIPWGNTGWTSVELTRPMPIPEDLRQYFPTASS